MAYRHPAAADETTATRVGDRQTIGRNGAVALTRTFAQTTCVRNRGQGLKRRWSEGSQQGEQQQESCGQALHAFPSEAGTPEFEHDKDAARIDQTRNAAQARLRPCR